MNRLSAPRRRRFARQLAQVAAFSAIVPSGAIAAHPSDAVERITIYTHDTAPNEYLDAYGVYSAFRHFGADAGGPIILLQRHSGNIAV